MSVAEAEHIPIDAMLRAVEEVLARPVENPNSLYIPLRTLFLLARPGMTRRGFRRWRARLRRQAREARQW